MARVLKHQRLVNPAKRKLTLKQKLHFGTARQRAAAKLALSGRAKKHRRISKTTIHRKRSVKKNPIGTIITLGMNPGKVGKMAKTRKRRNTSKRRVARRNPRKYTAKRRTNPFAVRHHRRRSNPSKVRMYYSKRRKRMVYRRKNPSLTGMGTKVLGVIAGAALTKMVTAMLPASFQTGILKYLGTGAVAMGLGWGVGKFGKAELGENVMVGGFTLLGLQVISDLVPGIAAYSGLSVGNVITGSSFYNPQVPQSNSMTSFLVPSAIPQMVVKSGKGMGRVAVPRGGWG
jgi:hypothetical protein